ncbi:MAG: energy transducer TonB [Desulfobacteraceae bacterium]|nr:energy transducer TonB [Desulfobacteraceae bacterium]
MFFLRYFDQKPNWLFLGLIWVSVIIHLGLLYEFGDIRQKTASQKVIEVDVAGPPDHAGRRSLPQPPRNSSALKAPAHAPVPQEPDDSAVNPELPAMPEDVAKHANPDVVDKNIVRWQGPDSLETEPEEQVKEPVEAPVEKQLGEDPGRQEQKADYFKRVRAAIEKKKQYPAFARRRQLEGKVAISFDIAGDGSISHISVIKSSGFSMLDEAALSAVRGAAPFDPPSEEDFNRFPLELEILIAFELKR